MKLTYILTISVLSAICVLHSEEEKRNAQNDPCPDCIMVTVLGHGVVEGKEGNYYFKVGYTLRQLLTDGTVELILRPSRQIRIQRKSEKNRMILVDRKKNSRRPNRRWICTTIR